MPSPEGNLTIAPNLLKEIDRVLARPGAPENRLDQVMGLLFERIDYYTWVGVYIMQGDELVLGPFRGKPSPHTRIPLHQGICGAAASQKQTIIVPDVNADPRFLACSLETRSEIVVPIMEDKMCLGEIDVDSDDADAFDETDQRFLEVVSARLTKVLAALAST